MYMLGLSNKENQLYSIYFFVHPAFFYHIFLVILGLFVGWIQYPGDPAIQIFFIHWMNSGFDADH